MQQAEIAELFGPLLQQGAQRRKITDYAALALLVIVLAGWGISMWRNNQVPKIEAISLVPGSVIVIGPAGSVAPEGEMEFCPGDTMTVRFELTIEGEGTIYADDSADYGKQTVKFSDLWRDIVQSGTRMYQDTWLIPPRPDMPIDGQDAWLPGRYERTISVAASNIYISRYVTPATFKVPFQIGEDCQ